jgi:hypothetical protein
LNELAFAPWSLERGRSGDLSHSLYALKFLIGFLHFRITGHDATDLLLDLLKLRLKEDDEIFN